MLLLFNVYVINLGGNITFFTLVATISSHLSLFLSVAPTYLVQDIVALQHIGVCLCVWVSVFQCTSPAWEVVDVRIAIFNYLCCWQIYYALFLQWHRFKRALRQHSSILHFNHRRSRCKCAINAKQTFFIFSHTLTVGVSEFLRFTKLNVWFFFSLHNENQLQQF